MAFIYGPVVKCVLLRNSYQPTWQCHRDGTISDMRASLQPVNYKVQQELARVWGAVQCVWVSSVGQISSDCSALVTRGDVTLRMTTNGPKHVD